MAKKSKTNNTTIDELAAMVKRGFDETAKQADMDRRFEEVDKRFGETDKQLAHIKMDVGHLNTVVNVMRHDITDLKKRFNYLDEIEDVLARLSLVEKTVGIKS